MQIRLSRPVTTGADVNETTVQSGRSGLSAILVVDHSDGLYTVWLNLTTAGLFAMHLAINSKPLVVNDILVRVVAGSADAATSVLHVIARNVRVGEAATLTLLAYDTFGNRLERGGDLVQFAAHNSSAWVAGNSTDMRNGTYSLSFASTCSSIFTTAVHVNGRASETGAVQLVFNPNRPDALRSFVEKDDLTPIVAGKSR